MRLPYRLRERSCGDAVRDDTQEHGQGDGREHALGIGAVQRVEGDQAEHDRRQAARSEPADERDGHRGEPSADERECHRCHAHDGERQYRERDGLPRRVVERGHHRRPEEEPDHERQELARLRVEVERRLLLAIWEHGSDREAADERGDEAVASEFDRQRVGARAQARARRCLDSWVRPSLAAC